MKLFKKILTALLAFVFVFALFGCNLTDGDNSGDNDGDNDNSGGGGGQQEPPVQEVIYDDERVLTDFEYTRANITGTDALGRTISVGDERQSVKRDVGIFYFLWLGQHPNEMKDNYDVSALEKNAPNEIASLTSTVSPKNQYHFWGKPLYGYYNSSDPWVITRHIELFVAAGIDFLVFDTTNAVTYPNVVPTILSVLDNFSKQGFNVPKVAFMTNTNAKETAINIYNSYYVSSSANYYPHLWYKPNGKPIIYSDPDTLNSADAPQPAMRDLFEIRKAQWPNKLQNLNNFPWMSWAYPQKNFSGTMSVSVAQHKTSKMSNQGNGNYGRGYSFTEKVNSTEHAAEGRNISGQWDTVYEANADGKNAVDTVFITGWNEWVALKLEENNIVFFVDQYNAEYSRDIEMDDGAFGDNYFMQMVQNIRKYQYTAQKHYKHVPVSIDVNNVNDSAWDNVHAFRDYAGDAIARNFRDYSGKATLTDNTNRNDIVSVKVASDSEYAYFRVECAGNISDYAEGDVKWMNLWINTTKSIGYEYVINREYGKLSKIGSNGSYTTVGDVTMTVSGKVLTVAVKLEDIGVNPEDPGFNFKVSDNVDASNPMNFYIQGDCAPAGRLSYSFGYVKK